MKPFACYAAALTAAFLLSVSIYAVAAPPGACDPWPACKEGGDSDGDSGKVAVNATFRDDLADAIRSDGAGPYPGDIDKARFSIPLGDLNRNLYLDFGACLSGAACASPFAEGLTDEALTWLAVRSSKQNDLLADEKLANVELRIRFVHNGTRWFLDFSPDIGNCEAGAGHITMTRDDADNWTFASAGGVACLQEEVSAGRGNKTERVFRGNYAMDFSVTATRQ